MVRASSEAYSKTPMLTLAALGVVFGDIGTSPLYTIKEVFSLGTHPVPLTTANIYGILSLIVWALIMVVSIKYVAFIMRADNRGEGGIMALLSLASRSAVDNPKKQRFVMLLGILGACMFYADGMITPAISVLSAVEGLEVTTTALHPLVIPITLCILLLLFWSQSKGTAKVGAFFGPIMLVWFATLATLGLMSIIKNPDILNALNPIYAIDFLLNSPWIGFVALGAVVLAVTGAEALYADMGHFGRAPIRMAWFGFVLPALVLNYFGQGALILSDPETIKNPFYLLAPEWLRLPLIILATLSAVIASQAVITGAFSVSRQALQLGYLPRMLVEHTSKDAIGQVYLPRVNWGLMLAVMALVIGFGSSSNLAAAYGIAVTGDMVITTLLASFVFRHLWQWSYLRTGIVVTLFLTIDLAFFGANVLKIPDGGWVPLLIGVITFTLMLTWKSGRVQLLNLLKNESIALNPFIHAIEADTPTKVPGTAIFLTPDPDSVPHALLHNLKHNRVLHEHILILTVKFADIPHVKLQEQIAYIQLSKGFYQVIIHYGFMDTTDIPKALTLCELHGLSIDPMTTSYFLSKEVLLANDNTNMAFWRKKTFIGLFKSAESVTNQFKLPPNRVIELGTQVSF